MASLLGFGNRTKASARLDALLRVIARLCCIRTLIRAARFRDRQPGAPHCSGESPDWPRNNRADDAGFCDALFSGRIWPRQSWRRPAATQPAAASTELPIHTDLSP